MSKLPYLAPALLAAACASHEAKTDVSDLSHSAAAAPTSSAAPASSARSLPQSTIAGNPLHDPKGPLARRSVYFDFDSNAVKDEYQPLIQAHSRYMGGHQQASMRIEGNCDERGSREYNLALGQRRAEALKRVMTVLGAPGNHIETVSYGEEKPAAGGHDETSWSKNRRDDIRYTSE